MIEHDGAERAPVLRVRFGDPEEFARELRARGPDVEQVVRLTRRWRPDPQGLPVRHLSVVAGYVRRSRGALVLYELVHHAGEVWQGTNEGASQRALARAERAHRTVARAAEEQCVEIAAGVYELVPPRPPHPKRPDAPPAIPIAVPAALPTQEVAPWKS